MDFSNVLDSPQLLASFVVGVVIPTIVGLVTKKLASSALKSWVLLFLSAVSTVLVAAVTTGNFETEALVNGFFVTFVTAVAAHYGFFKPAGVTGTEGVIQSATPTFGVGREQDPVPVFVDSLPDESLPPADVAEAPEED